MGTTNLSASPLCLGRSWNRASWKLWYSIWETGRRFEAASRAFSKGMLCLSYLMALCAGATDISYLYFCKAFVWHSPLSLNWWERDLMDDYLADIELADAIQTASPVTKRNVKFQNLMKIAEELQLNFFTQIWQYKTFLFFKSPLIFFSSVWVSFNEDKTSARLLVSKKITILLIV